MEHNASTFCFYCGRKVNMIYKNIKKSFNGKVITIYNVPLYSCKDCREIFYSEFVIDTFKNMSQLEIDFSSCDFKTLCYKIGLYSSE